MLASEDRAATREKIHREIEVHPAIMWSMVCLIGAVVFAGGFYSGLPPDDAATARQNPVAFTVDVVKWALGW